MTPIYLGPRRTRSSPFSTRRKKGLEPKSANTTLRLHALCHHCSATADSPPNAHAIRQSVFARDPISLTSRGQSIPTLYLSADATQQTRCREITEWSVGVFWCAFWPASPAYQYFPFAHVLAQTKVSDTKPILRCRAGPRREGIKMLREESHLSLTMWTWRVCGGAEPRSRGFALTKRRNLPAPSQGGTSVCARNFPLDFAKRNHAGLLCLLGSELCSRKTQKNCVV